MSPPGIPGAVLPALLGILVVLVVAGVLLAVHAHRTGRRVEAAVPPLGTFLDLDGARLHVLDRGDGPAIVLIHGLGGQMRNLTHPLLDRLAVDHRVVAIDRPGSGYSTRAPGVPAGIDTDADAVAAVVRHLKLDRPILVGHSLGGAVALATAVRHPESVGGLALLAPLTRRVDTAPEVFRSLEIRSKALRRAVGWTLAVPSMRRLRTALLREIFAPEPVHPDFDLEGGGLLGLRPSTFISAAADLVAVPDRLPAIEDAYGSIRVPVGVLYGSGDRILHPEIQGTGLLGRIEGVEVEIAEGGHMIPFTRPGLAEALVRRVADRMRNPR